MNDELKKKIAVGAAAAGIFTAGGVVGSQLNSNVNTADNGTSSVSEYDGNIPSTEAMESLQSGSTTNATDIFQSSVNNETTYEQSLTVGGQFETEISNPNILTQTTVSDFTTVSANPSTSTTTSVVSGNSNVNFMDQAGEITDSITTATTIPIVDETVNSTTSNTTTMSTSVTETAGSELISDNQDKYYEECYNDMVDAIGFGMYFYKEKNFNFASSIESTYGVKLTDAQRQRYETLFENTYNEYEFGILAYKLGKMDIFKQVVDEILNSKKYMCMDDLMDIVSININSRNEMCINNSSNYSISDGCVVIDGVKIENLINNGNDNNNFMNLIDLYKSCGDDRIVLDIFRLPKFIISEAVKPTKFSLCVNGTVYAYSDKELHSKMVSRMNYLSSKIGLSQLSYEKVSDQKVLFFGCDEQGNKQYIDESNPYINDLSQFLFSVYPAYCQSMGEDVGHFDGSFMKSFLQQWDAEQNQDQNKFSK